MLVYHVKTGKDVAKREKRSTEDGEKETEHNCYLMEIHKHELLDALIEAVESYLVLEFLVLSPLHAFLCTPVHPHAIFLIHSLQLFSLVYPVFP